VQSLLIAGMHTLQQFRDLHGRSIYYSTADAGGEFGNALDSWLHRLPKRVIQGMGLVLAGSVIAAPEGPERKSWEKRRGGTDFKALMVAEPKAVDTLDMAHAAPFHAKEPEDVFYDIAPLKYKGWSEFAEAPRNCCRSGSR
jgi:hypothetical protein